MLSVPPLVLRCNAAISYIPTCSGLAIRHPPLHFTAHHLPIHFISFFAFQRLVFMRTCSSISYQHLSVSPFFQDVVIRFP